MKNRIKEDWKKFKGNVLLYSGLFVIFISILTGSVNLLVGLLMAVAYQILLEVIRNRVKKWKLQSAKNT
ncbi:hypothetical protein PT158_07010 [Erysipelothrix rhusiopathiae]|nr:hypothetical protein [Erysipelothrix rhusiopathiae]MDE8321979.1 hypothetical protein [Erysipelothrix rhusiopathiae]